MAPDKTLARDIAALERRIDDHAARLEAIRKSFDAAMRGVLKTTVDLLRKRYS